jgi:hypothetical protein
VFQHRVPTKAFVMKRTVAFMGVWIVLASAPIFAQGKKDPLTDQQIEDVREAGDQPLVRVKLFVGYVDERAKEIHTLNADAGAQNKSVQMHNLFEEFTRLSDELEDNMDAYNDQQADLRKVLKEIIDKNGQWTAVLNEPKPNAQYDFMRKSAIDANQSVHDAATQMLADEVKYFADKKKAEKEQK